MIQPGKLTTFLLLVAAVSGCHLSTNANLPLTTTGDGVSDGTAGSSSGSSGSTSSGSAGVLDPLSVTAISPDKVSFVAGGMVTVTGTGFTARTRIMVGGLPCPELGVLSTTEATCIVKAHAVGPVPLEIFNYDAPATTFTKTLTYITDGFATASLLAGQVNRGNEDAIGPLAGFYDPIGITVDGDVAYILDQSNHEIRKVWLADDAAAGQVKGQVVTVAGDYNDGSIVDGTVDMTTPANNIARIDFPQAMTQVGQLIYFIDRNCIREFDLAGKMVTTRAGSCANTGAGNGAASVARFNGPKGITNDGTNLYVADTDNNMIRKVSLADFSVTTFAGQRTAGYKDLPGTAAKFDYPVGVTYVGGKVYVMDYNNAAVRSVVTATGVTATLGTKFANGFGKLVPLSTTNGITTDGTDVFVTDSNTRVIVRYVAATGEGRVVAGLYHDNNYDYSSYPGGDYPVETEAPATIDTSVLGGVVSIAFSPTYGLITGDEYRFWQIQ
jgi:sugar lactone lactonase YvrE